MGVYPNLRSLKHIRLLTDFSGCESWGLAARHLLGDRVVHVCASDKNPNCKRLIQHFFQPQHFCDDVLTRGPADMHDADLYCWSPPCVDWSTAGNQGGAKANNGWRLVKRGLRFIKHKRPRAAAFENVCGLKARHPQTYLTLLRYLKHRCGYRVWARVLDTASFGVPQVRRRVIVVAIRSDSVARPFSWPAPVHNLPDASSLLDPWDDHTDKARRLPTHPRQRALVKLGVEAARKNGVRLSRQNIFIDVGCTLKWRQMLVERVACLTATRTANRDWWVTGRGRRLTVSELFRFQGMEASDFPGFESVVSERAMCHMLGNTVSLNISEVVLSRVLFCAGLVSEQLTGRWV